MISAILFISFFIFLILGVPIGISLHNYNMEETQIELSGQ